MIYEFIFLCVHTFMYTRIRKKQLNNNCFSTCIYVKYLTILFYVLGILRLVCFFMYVYISRIIL
jgi:hypothetical protein